MTEKKMQLVDWLDDLCVRFIINLPREELESVERICFQVEEAQWFYEDFIRPLDPDLPSLNLRNFCLLIFQHCPMLSAYSTNDHAQAFSEFLAYKTRVPVRGAILLNTKMDEVILVKGWKKGANWSFPRGKINKDEPDLDCAIREVYEETGYDIKTAGLVGREEDAKYIEMNLREQQMRLYVFRGVPMDTFFEPRTRKEISKIQWWKLNDLPTLKKKKQQQDSQGAELAINVNKFYMVAPFLPQLKKWISGQRKLDKTKHSNDSAGITVENDEAAITGSHDTKEGKSSLPSNGDLNKLLEGLRESARPEQPSQLPEVTEETLAAVDVAARLKTVLGVPAKPLTTAGIEEEPQRPELQDNSKANSLLALLRSGPARTQQLPQTPMEQIIEQPSLPPSPPRLHDQPLRFSDLPTAPAFPTSDILAREELLKQQQLRPPQTRPIEPPQQPARLVAQYPPLQPKKTLEQNNKDVPNRAPYQRTGDPQFTHPTPALGTASAIPRASKLPPPKLNAQSSALLSLFKSNVPPKALGGINSMEDHPSPEDQTAPSLKSGQNPGIVQSNNRDCNHGSAQVRPQQISRLTDTFVPPQISSSTQPEKTLATTNSKSEHHGKLLNLFRNPSTTAEPVRPKSTTLQLPPTAFELSALPTTPSHSRAPSKVDRHVRNSASPTPLYGTVRLEQRPQIASPDFQTQPVSATIHGPLNMPQFDMVASVSKERKQVPHTKANTLTPRRSPITILARPASSRTQSTTPPKQETVAMQHPQETLAPRLQTIVTPIKQQKPPPTPDLKGHEAPPKPFHPQILRRSAQPDDSNEPSPIQPLPSPKHNPLVNHRPTQQPIDHKKSLLSLFTKPSPAVSPASGAVPSSAIDPSALISPLGVPTPQEQADAAFARLAKDVGKLSHDPPPSKVPGPSHQPALKTGGVSTVNGLKPGRNGDKKSTPVDNKAFLLGFLNSVAEQRPLTRIYQKDAKPDSEVRTDDQAKHQPYKDAPLAGPNHYDDFAPSNHHKPLDTDKPHENNDNHNLDENIETHFVPVVCRWCKQNFSSKNALHRHLRAEHYSNDQALVKGGR